MGVLVAPYNTAMRLGYGFNSFTQTLCVNDAVVKDNRKTATEDDLKRVPQNSVDPDDISQIVTYTSTLVQHSSEVMDAMGIKGSVEIKLQSLGGGGGGQASYVNTEQMKNSDINFLIQVKVVNQKLVADNATRFNAIANLPANSFTETYGDSFISGFVEGGEFYALLSIKLSDKHNSLDVMAAVNAKISQPGVDISGDVSGSLNKMDAMSDAQTSISVSWSGGGEIRSDDDRGKDWTIESMKRAANTFPERVARCPQRTHAILTKYTALRSYQELTNRGTPLDYENAGVYTGSLLDAYMDYKDIWKTLATMTKDVQSGRKLVARTDEANEFRDYAQEAQYDYAQKTQAYFYPITDVKGLPDISRFKQFQSDLDKDPIGTTTQPTDGTASSSFVTADQIYNMDIELAKINNQLIVATRKLDDVQKGQSFEPPLKPNDLTPYSGSLMGLDRARRDCRWEMIKIVKEVDAVTLNPAVATDTSRVWQYLNPAVFRQLIPEYSPPPPPYPQSYVDKLQKLIDDAEKDKQDAIQAAVKSRDDEITALKAAPDTAEAQKLDDLRTALGRVESSMIQGVAVSGLGDGRMYSGNLTDNINGLSGKYKQDTIPFPKPFSAVPRVISGISMIDFLSVQETKTLSMSCNISQASKTGLTSTRSIGDCSPYDFGISWMTLPENGPHIETGTLDTADFRTAPITPSDTCNYQVFFQQPFKNTPYVRVWLQAVSWDGVDIWRRVDVYCVAGDASSCTLRVATSDNTTIRSARLCWLAYEKDERRITSGEKAITTLDRAVTPTNNDKLSYNIKFSSGEGGATVAFPSPPTVFTALSLMGLGTHTNVRLMTRWDNVKTDAFDLTLSTWNDTTLINGKCIWIAISS